MTIANEMSEKNCQEWLRLAGERLPIPNNYLKLYYQPEVDLLVIRLSEGHSTYSKDNHEKGLIFNYDAQEKLISIEILDLYGIFTTDDFYTEKDKKL